MEFGAIFYLLVRYARDGVKNSKEYENGQKDDGDVKENYSILNMACKNLEKFVNDPTKVAAVDQMSRPAAEAIGVGNILELSHGFLWAVDVR